MRALRVAIDLTSLPVPAGRTLVETLPTRFVDGLVNHASEVEFSILGRQHALTALHIDSPRARRVLIDEPNAVRIAIARLRRRVRRHLRHGRFAPWLGWAEQLGRASGRLRGSLGVDVIFRPFTGSGIRDPGLPLVVAVSDLAYLSHPYLVSRRERAAPLDLGDAAAVICASGSLRADLVRTAGVPTERTHVIPASPLVVSQAPVSDNPALLNRHGVRRKQYVLVVGDDEARSNLRVVLTALGICHASRGDATPRVLFVADQSSAGAPLAAAAERMGLAHTTAFSDLPARDELSTLIDGAQAIVAAPLYENVGEVVSEAVRRGRPVLCSHLPSLIDLTGGKAHTFDPHRPAELAALLARVQTEPALLERTGPGDPQQTASVPDTQHVADAYLNVLSEAASACRQSR